MTRPQDPWEPIADRLIAEVRARLSAGKAVRRTLPGGRLHMDRPLPFLCVYRFPPRPDEGTRQLVLGEASFLFAPGAATIRKSLSKLVAAIVEVMTARFGAFLIIEVWSTSAAEVIDAHEESLMEPTELRPAFTICARGPSMPARTVAMLRANLERIQYLRQRAEVAVDYAAEGHPPGLPPFFSAKQYQQFNCQTIGLAVRPMYRDPGSGDVFPAVLRTLRRGVGRSLKQAFFKFTQTRTNAKPRHFYSLGRRAMVKAVWKVDARLAEISDSFDFLLQVTPVNAAAAWREFRKSRFEKAPRFYYRPLAVEPTTMKRRLYEVAIENIEDPTLAHLFRQRQDELDRKITMLSDIGSPRFLLGSLQVYGGVHPPLLDVASQLLNRIPPHARDDSRAGHIEAAAFAEHAREEIAAYRRQYPDFTAEVIVRDDIFSGMLCSGGDLLIGRQTRVPVNRVRALLQHEVGTHLLTYYNGLAEPFQQLHGGFAGYDALQEGLAVLAEYLVGGLSRPRMRLLAARVVAAAQMISGATFVETFRLLDRHYEFSQRVAYTLTMRTYRGGGLTKDVVYLSGLLEMLDYLATGGDLEPLWVGKIATDHIPLIRELRHRQVIKPPPLSPLYLHDPEALRRLGWLRQKRTVLDLISARLK
ncbi:MAG: DUF1704 domain-containing protein [Planctomycetales bacterium]|nr:DUF1704 domain-containing protein [Planctomycetales bacterium]